MHYIDCVLVMIFLKCVSSTESFHRNPFPGPPSTMCIFIIDVSWSLGANGHPVDLQLRVTSLTDVQGCHSGLLSRS